MQQTMNKPTLQIRCTIIDNWFSCLLYCHWLEEIFHLLLLLPFLVLLLLILLPLSLLLQEVRIAAGLYLLLYLGDKLLRLAPFLVLEAEGFVLDNLFLLLHFCLFTGPCGRRLLWRHYL